VTSETEEETLEFLFFPGREKNGREMEKTKDRTPEDNTAYATKQYWDQRYEQCVFPSIFSQS
jgi:hypothetical protein